MLLSSTSPSRDVVSLCRNLGLMLEAGTRLHDAVAFALAQTRNPKLECALAGVYATLLSGKSLSFAMMDNPDVFPPTLANAVYAGEEAGCLGEVLLDLASFYKDNISLRDRLASTLIYPLAVTTVTAGVFAFLVVFILPKIVKIHAAYGVEVPSSPLALLAVGRFLTSPAGLVLALLATAALVLSFTTARGRRLVDRLCLRLPYMGDLVRSYLVSQFCGLMSILVSRGMPIPDSVEVLSRTAENDRFRLSIEGAHARVASGESLASSLDATALFPDDVLAMIHTGEEANRLQPLLREASCLHREIVDNGSRTLLSLIEPAFMLVLGGGICMIVASLYLPLIRLTTALATLY